MTREKQRIHFRLIRMPCCGQTLYWVNSQLPNHCPECGKKLKFGSQILVDDEEAWLTTVSGAD
jgi:hypothetical protein